MLGRLCDSFLKIPFSVKYKNLILYEIIRTSPKFLYFTEIFNFTKKIRTLPKILYFTKKIVHQMKRCPVIEKITISIPFRDFDRDVDHIVMGMI